jgi:hypothetical protein
MTENYTNYVVLSAPFNWWPYDEKEIRLHYCVENGCMRHLSLHSQKSCLAEMKMREADILQGWLGPRSNEAQANTSK